MEKICRQRKKKAPGQNLEGILTFRSQEKEKKPKKPGKQEQNQKSVVLQKPTERGFQEGVVNCLNSAENSGKYKQICDLTTQGGSLVTLTMEQPKEWVQEKWRIRKWSW